MNAQQLRAAMAALPEHGEFAPIFDWDHHRWQLRKDVLDGRSLDELLGWPTMRLTMVVVHAPYSQHEYEALMQDDWPTWRAAIRRPELMGDRQLPWDYHATGTLVHQAYHLMSWQQAMGRKVVDCDGIVEIGGGFGAMALVCRQLGYTGPYTILDVPEISLLQQYYLERIGIGDVNCVTEPAEVPEADLCVSVFSTSELYLHERWLPAANSYLMAYYPACDDIDNEAWFENWAATIAGMKWLRGEACMGGQYLFGVRE